MLRGLHTLRGMSLDIKTSNAHTDTPVVRLHTFFRLPSMSSRARPYVDGTLAVGVYRRVTCAVDEYVLSAKAGVE